MKRIVYVLFVALFVAGCSNPRVEITFHYSPSNTDKIVRDIKTILTNHGLRAWNHEWIDSKKLTLGIAADMNKALYKETIAGIFDPMLWKSRKSPDLRIQITENSMALLSHLELQEGELFTVTLNWDDADYGIFGILVESHGQHNAGTTYNCTVRVPITGDIPKLTYRYKINNPGAAQNAQGTNEFIKFFQAVNKLNPTVSHTVTLSGHNEDDTPWSKVEFANRVYSSAYVMLNGLAIKPKVSDLKDALFVFAPCARNHLDSTIGEEYALILPECPEFTDETCAQKIRELANGDFYGVTGYEISGNVEQYEATW